MEVLRGSGALEIGSVFVFNLVLSVPDKSSGGSSVGRVTVTAVVTPIMTLRATFLLAGLTALGLLWFGALTLRVFGPCWIGSDLVCCCSTASFR